MAAAVGVAVFSGAISIAQQNPPLPQPNPAAAAAVPAAVPAARGGRTYGDWVHSCREVPQSGAVRCSIAQQVSDAESGAVVFIWRIAQSGEGGLIGVWQTPQAVLLSRGVTLDAGTSAPVTIPFDTCGDWGCQAVAPLALDHLAAFTTAERAAATIVLDDGRVLNLSLSVDGLGEALAALRQSSQQP